MQAVSAKTSLYTGARAKPAVAQIKKSTPLSAKQTLKGAPLRPAANGALRWRASVQVTNSNHAYRFATEISKHQVCESERTVF